MAHSIKAFGQLCHEDFFFSSTSGVRQFYLVLWLTGINGRIEEPCIKEIASANARLVHSLIDVSVRKLPCLSFSIQTVSATETIVALLSKLFTCPYDYKCHLVA